MAPSLTGRPKFCPKYCIRKIAVLCGLLADGRGDTAKSVGFRIEGDTMIAPDNTGECPHCGIRVRFEQAILQSEEHTGLRLPVKSILFVTGGTFFFDIIPASCPGCSQLILTARSKGSLQSSPEKLDSLFVARCGGSPRTKGGRRAEPRIGKGFS